MIERFSKSELRYLKQLIIAYDNEVKGELNSLMLIYEDYGMPQNKSPQEVLATCIYRDYIEQLKSKKPNNSIIEYYDQDIMVNVDLLKTYLQTMDPENQANYGMFYKFMKIEDINQFMLEILEDEYTNDSKEYFDLPF